MTTCDVCGCEITWNTERFSLQSHKGKKLCRLDQLINIDKMYPTEDERNKIMKEALFKVDPMLRSYDH